MKTAELVKLAQDIAPYTESVCSRVRATIAEVFRLRRKLAVLRAGGTLPPTKKPNSPENVRARARDIAEGIRRIMLGRIEDAVELFAEQIEVLVDEATKGAPRPVNPPLDERYVFPWDGNGWVICGEEPEVGPRPLLVFVGYGAEKAARKELARRQALDADDDDHLDDEAGVLSTQAALSIWNSIDPDPRLPAPDSEQG